VVTDTVSHLVGTNYFLTGRFSESDIPRGSSVPTLIAAQQGGARLVPHLAIGNLSTFNDSFPAYATGLNITSPSDFSALLGQGKGPRFSPRLRDLVHEYQTTRACDDRRDVVTRFLGSQAKAWQTAQSDIANQLDFFSPGASPELRELAAE